MENIKPRNISAIEKLYPFENVKVASTYANGLFGTVANGVFTIGATGTHFLYDVEKGDDAHSDDYVIAKDAYARACALEKLDGQEVQICPAILPSSVAVGNKLVSGADGKLVVSADASEGYIKVTAINAYAKTGCIGVVVA